MAWHCAIINSKSLNILSDLIVYMGMALTNQTLHKLTFTSQERFICPVTFDLCLNQFPTFIVIQAILPEVGSVVLMVGVAASCHSKLQSPRHKLGILLIVTETCNDQRKTVVPSRLSH